MHRSHQLFPVIYTAAENDLTAHLDLRIVKAFQIRKALTRIFVFQHENAQFRIRRMNGNINRRHAHLYNAVDILIG